MSRGIRASKTFAPKGPHITPGQDAIWQNVIVPQRQKEEQQRCKEALRVNCAICGKSIPLNRAVEQDDKNDKLICQDCYYKLHTSKRLSKK